MTGASEDLLQAVYGLRKAAEAQFTGNAYYQVANEINALIESLGWGDGSIPVGKDAAYGFSTMLAEVRKLAEAGTSGNQYYAIVCKLDRLASYLTPSAEAAAQAREKPAAVAAAPAVAPMAAPASAPVHTPSAAKPAFADLATASKARVEEVAASLGITPAHHASPDPAGHAHDMESPSAEAAHGAAKAVCPFHAMFAEPAAEAPAEPSPAAHPTPPSQAEAAEAPSERRLESRSSEAVSQVLESVEPAAISGETAPEPSAAETALHLGSPAAEGEAFAAEETAVVEVGAVEIAVEPAVPASAPAPDAAPSKVVHKIEVNRPVETKPKEPKTLFKLWLDLAFGRKD